MNNTSNDDMNIKPEPKVPSGNPVEAALVLTEEMRDRLHALIRRACGAESLQPGTPGLAEIKVAAEALLRGAGTEKELPLVRELREALQGRGSLASHVPEAWSVMYGARE